MSLLLAVESTSGLYSVAVGRTGGTVASQSSRRDEPGFGGLGKLAEAALTELGATMADVDELAVDIGPGNLSSVRAAVAYVNGLAFSRDIRIFCASSLELLAAGYSENGALPVLCLRKASGGNAYLGRYEGAVAIELRFGAFESSVTAMCADLPALAVAGGPADVVAKLLPEASVEDSGIEHPSIDVLYQLARRPTRDPGRVVELAHPLNEGSSLFHSQAVTDER